MSNQPRRRGPMGGGHGRMGTGEKAKDFKGTMKKLQEVFGISCKIKKDFHP